MESQHGFIPFRSWVSPAINVEERLFQFCHSSTPLLLTTHINADPDGLGALLGIWDLCRQLHPERKIFFWIPVISLLSRKLLLELGLFKIVSDNMFKLPIASNLHGEKDVNSTELANSFISVEPSVNDVKNIPSLRLDQSIDFDNHYAGCYDLLLCDTQNLNIVPNASQLLEYSLANHKLTFNELILFDHHIKTPTPTLSSNNIDIHSIFQNVKDFVFPEFKATSELILQLYAFTGLKPSDNIFKILVSGIITDSRRLILADSALLANLSYWLKIFSQNDFSLVSLIEFMDNDYSHGEVLARLKGAQRMIICQVPPIIYIITHLSSHEATAARGILQLGADIVFAIAEGKTETRVSIRCKNSIIHKYNFNSGKLAELLAQKFENATGNGHAGAAGVNIPSKIPWTNFRVIIQKEMDKLFNINPQS